MQSETENRWMQLRTGLSDRRVVMAFVGVSAVTALLLHLMGRSWIAASGRVLLWVSDTFSAENSQHLSDPYSFSHMQHGLVFFFVLLWLAPKIPLGFRFVISAAMEGAWELIENSPFIIDRYRAETAAIGYVGDSILNSMSDIACCSLGFLVAHMLGGKKTLVLFLLVEIAMIVTIRDSLLINVIMLIHPIPALKAWQSV